MTLESAIKHAEQVAVREDNNAQVYDKIKNDNLYHPDKITCEQTAKRCRECAAEHRQLAEWLKELKDRREKDVSDINVGDMISRQVAIDALCRRCDLAAEDDDPCTEKCNDIKILEKLPSAQPEPCEDAISRQRLLNDLKELIVVWGKYPVMAEPIKGIGTAIGYVAAIPSVTPERKMGKWILLEECANAGYYCSECRKRVVKEGWSGTVKKIKFCPNCGADMRSETEQEAK